MCEAIRNNQLRLKIFQQLACLLTLSRCIRCEGNNGDLPVILQQTDHIKHMLEEDLGSLALC